ncbi:probable ascorbate-specific transmembrane electron transporter 1 [Rhododendron vialii]|uniref:probable ascorbate-specific transmembrane electron transporter 1 n=1 Tax=Rhododendron vialii TaxID=182163 RepID=UPI00265F98F3|nr:probable ascorbate-specific transmembrane electron transporter 1 [Rhododendron vialii]
MATKNRSDFKATSRPATIFAQVVMVAVFTLVLVWLLHFRGGLAFNSTNKQKIFNVHPLLMVIGFILISGEGIMMHKIVPASKDTRKLLHLTWLFIALVAAIVGICAVFKFHNELDIPNMYTLHSWIGMSTICLCGIQWTVGFFSFFWPGAEQETRARLIPWHAVFGMVIFLMAILTAETGLIEKFTFLKLTADSQEALIVNFTGLLLILFAISVGLSVLLPQKH